MCFRRKIKGLYESDRKTLMGILYDHNVDFITYWNKKDGYVIEIGKQRKQ